MMELDPRKQLVLGAVVTEYVRTAEPVGSERLAESNLFAAKSATIRNELAALANMGLLVQPHTSAGRIPSDRGYRFYVDRLMVADAPPRVPVGGFSEELDEVLRQTCRLLAGLTRCAAVATPPQSDTIAVQQIHVTPVTLTRVLVAAILSSSEVEHRIVELGEAVPAASLTRLTNLLNEQLSGLSLEAGRKTRVTLPGDMATLASAAAKIREALAGMLKRDADQEAVLEGATQVLREPEFQDDDRRERLLRALEDRRELLESLRGLQAEDVDVTIGSENLLPSMREFSFVSTRYFVGLHMTGVIGVFGPTRMAYAHTVPTVRSMARVLGHVLTRLSLE
ncbi:MAG TPA: heat-inducible transcriptional repressor HrcA [Armatimonadota bacterium]|jgi:heat-inducible transcriptional repressor